jgi:hypothetical protein
VVIVQGQGKLLEVVRAGHPIGSFTHSLDSRQQQSDQDCNNGNNDKQLDQCKRPSGASKFHKNLVGVLV